MPFFLLIETFAKIKETVIMSPTLEGVIISTQNQYRHYEGLPKKKLGIMR